MEHLVGVLTINLFLFPSISKIISETIDKPKYKIFISYILLVAVTLLNSLYSISFVKLINSLLIYISYIYLFCKRNFKSSIIGGSILLLMCTISEIIYLVIWQMLFSNFEIGKLSIQSAFINNLAIGIILLLMCHLLKINKLYNAIIKVTNKLSERFVITLAIFLIGAYNILSAVYIYVSLGSIDMTYFIATSSLITIIMCVIVFYYMRSTNQYIVMSEKYNLSLDNIREYEKVFDQYRMLSHENKNHLLAIRNMSKNRKIITYIDALVENQLSDDEQILLQVVKVPAGGLRGLIYSKLLVMKDKDIVFELLIDKKNNFRSFSKISNSLLIDICKILGVFIDNAIEAVEKLDEKYIIIEIYKYNRSEIAFSVTNNYNGYIDVENISKIGYSTKGDNHGYGLALVHELVNKHNELYKETEFIEDNFIQKLYIKL